MTKEKTPWNPEHLEVVKKGGAEAIKTFRKTNPDVPFDLTRANLMSADLIRADLRVAELSGAQLNRSNLISAILKGANLNDANLRDANLRDANLDGANLYGANLDGTDLRRTKNLNLTGARGYILDGQDISTWLIPPAPIMPRWRTANSPSMWRWQWWLKGWAPVKDWWPYSDPWSTVRSYTGVMTAFHLLLALTALGPYALRGVLATARTSEHDLPRIALVLGWNREDAWFLVPTGIVLVTYNLFRLVATWWLSQVREEEVRTRHAPTTSQYMWWWSQHSRYMRWVGYSAIGLGFWRTGRWLCEWV